MNIVCVICSDLLTPSDDVFHTPCGHIFHYACLLQWLERSKTCPQCRDRTTNQTIRRIYFNFSNNDNISEDASSLQNKIDNMTFQLKLKDENLNNLTAANEKLKKQASGLIQEVKKTESEVNSKNSAIHALKEQIKFYKHQCLEVDNYRKENEDLKKNLGHLKNIQSLIDSSVTKVDDIITETRDVSKLVTYIAVLKRELTNNFDKSKEIREKYKNLLQKFTRVTRENTFLSQECAKRKELEEQLMICESEKMSLQTQLLNMQTDVHKYACNEMSVENRDNLKAQKEHNAIKEFNLTMNGCLSELEDISSDLRKFKDDIITVDSDSTEDTPQSIKSQGFFSMTVNGLKRQKSNNSLKVPSILKKKSRINDISQRTDNNRGMSFDGFGGHAKYDKFPDPIPSSHVRKTKEDLKTRKPKLDTGDNKKIFDIY